MLENWTANVDMQVIVDQNGCARYMAKYVAKGEPRSKQALEILRSCVSRLQDDEQVSTAIKKAVIKVAGDQDMGAQETAHVLLSLPLVGCTYNFVTVCLENSRKVVLENDEHGETLQNSVIVEYANRTSDSRYKGLSQLNLMQYVSQYNRVRTGIRKRAVPFIVRIFPKVSSNPHGPDFGRYCKYQLIKFKPWVDDPSNAWDNDDESEDMFINSYYLFLDTDFAHDNVLDHGRELDKVFARVSGQSYDEDGDNANSDDDAHENNEKEEEVEDWIMLCRLNQHYEESGNPMFEAAKSVLVEVLRRRKKWKKVNNHLCIQRLLWLILLASTRSKH